MFKLPRLLGRLPKPAISIPELNPIKHPNDGAIFWRYTMESITQCTVIVSVKGYDVFGQLVETKPSIIIRNPSCEPRKPPSPDDEKLWDLLSEPDLKWEVWCKRRIEEEYEDEERKSILNISIEPEYVYKQYPGNQINNELYALGDYQLYDKSMLSRLLRVRLFKDTDELPQNAITSRQTRYSRTSFPVDRYGNFVDENETPVTRDDWGRISGIIPEEEITPLWVEQYPAYRWGVSLTAVITFNFSIFIKNGKIEYSDDDLTGQTISYSTSITKEYDVVYKVGMESDQQSHSSTGTGNEWGNVRLYNTTLKDSGGNVPKHHWNQGFLLYETYIDSRELPAIEEITNLGWNYKSPGGTEYFKKYEPYYKLYTNKVLGMQIAYVWVSQNTGEEMVKPSASYLLSYYKRSYYLGGITKTYWINYGEMPPMDDKCCGELKRLLKIVIKQQGKFPKTVFNTALTEEGVQPQLNKKINSIAEFLDWQFERLDELMGEWESSVKIKDGEEEEILRLPNLAEATSEIYALALQNFQRNETILNIVSRVLLESASIKQQDFKTHEAVLAIIDWMNFETKDKILDMPLLCNPAKAKDYATLLTETEVEVSVTSATDKTTLNETLANLMFAAGIIKGKFYNQTGQNLGQIIPAVKEGLEKIAGEIDVQQVQDYANKIMKEYET